MEPADDAKFHCLGVSIPYFSLSVIYAMGFEVTFCFQFTIFYLTTFVKTSLFILSLIYI